MTQRISDYLNVEPAALDRTGAFNGFLDEDTNLFIDPRLLKKTAAPELQESYQRIRDRFSKVIKLLSLSQSPGDVFWRNADVLLDFPEVRGLCIGYCSGSTDGSGIGPELRTQLLETAKIIIDAGIEYPELFEVMGLFEKDIGADRICDMIATIIMPDLLAYSKRVFNEIGVSSNVPFVSAHKKIRLPQNPHSLAPIILVPKDVLSNLPLAHSHQDIGRVVALNRELRQELNQIIGDVWGKNRPTKPVYKRAVLNHPDFLAKLIEFYQESQPNPYDLNADPAGQHLWFERTKKMVRENPMDLVLGPQPSLDEVLEVVKTICAKFKQLIENNGLHTLLYRDNECTEPKHEEAAQKVFYGIANSYCEANDLDLSPETNSGRGSVDFKVSKGFSKKVLVETKLSSNKKLEQGFFAQLEEYEKAEQTQYSVYLVIDVGGCTEQRWERFQNALRDARQSARRLPRMVYVNGRRKPPASKTTLLL